MAEQLTDEQVLSRLMRAGDLLGVDVCQTVRGATAMTAARRAISMLVLSLEIAAEEESDVVGVILKPDQ